MATLLQINSSLFGDNGNSSQLSQEFVQHWKTQHPDGKVVVRDFAKETVPHLDAARVQALFTPEADRTAEQQAVLDYSDRIIAEIQAADAIVIGVPLYNFGVPSTLKAYFDHIARAGVTFKYTETGPQGLLSGKRAIVLTARGGIYAGGSMDHQEPYLRQALAFIGIHDVRFVHAEGLNLGAEFLERGVTGAKTQLAELV